MYKRQLTGWEEQKFPVTQDNAWKIKLKGIVDPKIKDETKKDLFIWEDPDVKAFHAAEKTQSCSSCGGLNCRILYRLSHAESKGKDDKRLGT